MCQDTDDRRSRQFKISVTDAEYEEIMALTPDQRRAAWLVTARQAAEAPLALRIPIAELTHTVTYYCTNDLGMTPEIKDEIDLISWTVAVVADITGDDRTPLQIHTDGEHIVIRTTMHVIDEIRDYLIV